MIIAVGYRVNSKRATIFRQWVNRVLKQYMLKGYAIDSSRVLVTRENYLDFVNVVNRIDSTRSELITRTAQCLRAQLFGFSDRFDMREETQY